LLEEVARAAHTIKLSTDILTEVESREAAAEAIKAATRPFLGAVETSQGQAEESAVQEISGAQFARNISRARPPETPIPNSRK
jgi:hypothetical protein